MVTMMPVWNPRVGPTNEFVRFAKEEVEQSIPQRFEKIVRRYPDRIAIKMGEEVTTYAQLNAMANRVARAILAQQGNQAEAVGLLLDRGAPLVAAMLGVLKAGKFFVPLDPSFPKARIAATLEDSQAEVVVTDRQNVSLAREVACSDARLVMEVEAIDSMISTEDLRSQISPTSLACIVYTSGSTGQPKGVVRDHRGWLHSVMLETNATHAGEDDRVSLLTSGTAAAVAHTFFALLSGAGLFPFDVGKNGVTRLASWLVEERISICLIAAPLFRKLCESLTGEERFPDLRVLRLGMEAVHKSDVDLYKRYFSSNSVLLNALICSEAGSLSMYRMDQNTEIAGSEVPVGYPLEDKEILVLDDGGEEVGFEEVGEIAVRSRYLSAGYWRNPELTKAKFRADPNGGDMRLYMTGDLGLMRPDGCLIYKGRKDFRVKIRGYGVEMAEVEKCLLSHPAVREAVVVARQNEVGESYLVAYFTSDSEPAPSIRELRVFLKEKLAEYMIPSAFVILDALPLAPSGKVDRKALPAPDSTRPQLEQAYVAPRTITEQQLVQIWEKVLGVRPIGVHDDFFDLGGDSLLGAAVMAQVEQEFEREMPVGWLFESPTISALAKEVDGALNGKQPGEWSGLIRLGVGRGRRPIFCFPHAGGFRNEYSRFTKIARLIGGAYSCYGVRARGTDGRSQPHHRVTDMATDYVREIQTVQPHGPYFLLAECGGASEAYETARQLKARGEEIGLLAFFDGVLSGFLFKDVGRWLLGRWWYRIWDFRTLGSFVRRGILAQMRRMRRLRGSERARYLLNKAVKIGEIGSKARLEISSRAARENMDRASVNREVLRHLKRSDELHRQAVRRHRFHWYGYWVPPYEGKITLLVSEEWYSAAPTLGWNDDLVRGGLEVHKIPGDHNTYITENVHLVASVLRECLEKAEARLE